MPGRLPKPSLPIISEDALSAMLIQDPTNLFLLTLLSAYWFLRYAAGCREKKGSDLTVATAADRIAKWMCEPHKASGNGQASGKTAKKLEVRLGRVRNKEFWEEVLIELLLDFISGKAVSDDYCSYARILAAWVEASNVGGKRLRDLSRPRRLGEKVSTPTHFSDLSTIAETLKKEIAIHRIELQSRGINHWKNRDYLLQLLGYLTAPAPLGFALLLIILISKDAPDDCANNLQNLLKVYNPFLDPMVPRKGLAELYAFMDSEIGSTLVELEEGMLNLHMLHAWQRGKNNRRGPWRVPLKERDFREFFTQRARARGSLLPTLKVNPKFDSIISMRGEKTPIAVPSANDPLVALQSIRIAGRKPLELSDNYFEGRRFATEVAEQVFNHELAASPPDIPPWITANHLDLGDKDRMFGALEMLEEHRRRFLEYLFLKGMPRRHSRLREMIRQKGIE